MFKGYTIKTKGSGNYASPCSLVQLPTCDGYCDSSLCYNGCREVAGWQHQGTKSDAELEVDGFRSEIVYAVQPVDCDGTVIPAYMDINDAKWDDDPRVLHWRRETQLGRMPRRETPKTADSRTSANTSAPQLRTARDPRIKTNMKSQCPQPASTMSQLQQQQQHIQQVVQQLMQCGTLVSSSATAAALPAAGPVTASAPLALTVTNSTDKNTSQFPQLPHLEGGGNLPLQTASASLQPNNSSSVESLVAGNAVCSATGTASTSLPSITNDVQKSVTLPVPAAEPSSEKPASAAVTNKAKNESDVAVEQRKVDYHNNPRFKRKIKSSAAKQDSNKSALPVSDSKPSASGSARTETGLQSRDVLQFQSPLAVADNTRLLTAASSYNRPPNKRYQELLEQGNQQPPRDRYTGFSDPRRKHISAVSDKLEKTSSVHSLLSTTLQAVVTYPGIVSEDAVSSDSLAKGSLKDMFKTIDPTASPFC